MDNLLELNKALNGQVKENEPLGVYTTFKLGGPARYYFVAQSSEQLVEAVKTAVKLKFPFYILGGGSNILISDSGFPGLVIRNQTREIKVVREIGKVVNGETQKEVLIEVDTGVLINRLVRYCCDEGLQGLEMHLGLPGTVGGALYMNSKWTHPDAYVGDVLYKAKIMDKNGEIREVDSAYFDFGYDQSILQKTHETVVTATFRLKKAEPKKLWETANASMEYRKNTQPTGVRTAGCIFRNVSADDAEKVQGPNMTKSAGYMIDQVGLKGFISGQAQFSDKHANFIYNLGNATSQDVKNLIDEAKRRVLEQFDVKIEPEIVLLGDFR